MKHDNKSIKPLPPKHRPYKVLESEYVAQRPWFTVRCEKVELPTGVVVPEWYVFEFPDWVNVIAITRDGEFVMINQYRHAAGETRYELVAGCCEEGERPEESARRELLEETGYGGGRWEPFMVTSANPSNHTNRVYTFLAVGVEKLAEQHTEAGEDIEVHLFSREQVEALLSDDEIMQCLHAAPLWKYMLRNPF